MKLFSSLFLLTICCSAAGQVKFYSLQDVIDHAMSRNYDIRLVRNQAQSYAIDAGYADAGFLPTLNGTGSKIWNANSQKQNFADGRKRQANTHSANLNATVNLNWTLFDGLKMFATRERLEQLKTYGELTVRTQVVNSIAAIINNYYNVVRQKQQLRAIDTLISISQQRVDLADRKFSLGLGAKPELLQAKVDLNAQKAARLLQLTLIDQLRQQLNQLSGLPVDEQYEVSDSIPINLSLSYPSLLTGIETANPNLAAIRKTVDVAALELRERRAERFPIVQFNSGYVFGKTNNGSVVNPEFQPIYSQNKGLNYGFSATIPILNGFNTRRLIRQAGLTMEYNQITYDAERSKLLLALANSFKDYEYEKTALQLEEDNISLAMENVFISLQRFRQGVASYIELRDAQTSLQDAFTRLITARYNTKVAETELLRLRGNLSSSVPSP